MHRRLSLLAIGIVFAAAPTLSGTAINSVDIFKNVVYTQSSAAAPTTPSSFFADIELTSNNAGDYDGVSVAYPGPGSPASLPQVSPTFFSFGPSYATLAAMNAGVPFGAYNYTATNSGNPAVHDTATLAYTQDAFASAIPALSAASFNSLNGLNPSTALTILFNSFSQNGAASEAFTFFSIFSTGGTVFTAGFLSPSATSAVLPANTLLPNTTYSFELDFSDRINGSDPNGIPTLVGSDVRTDGSFTTGALATPEPGTELLIGSGLLAALVLKRRFA
jgi:hypothetical protein